MATQVTDAHVTTQNAPKVSHQDKARLALLPSLNGAVVIEAYQSNIMGKDTDVGAMIDGMRDTFKDVKAGDLHILEAMLISQATALQTIFTHLAKRAAAQEQMRHYEAFLGLALKAQAQSRATISALVNLKYPRQATFVKQANIAHGPQQVNNETLAHTGKSEIQQNKLLEDNLGSTYMDTGAATATARGDSAVEAVGTINRAKERKG